MNLLNVLTAIFVTLKLAGLVTWSWFFVLSPTLILILIWLVVYSIIGTIGVKKIKESMK